MSEPVEVVKESESPGTMIDRMFKEAIALAYKRGVADGVKSAIDEVNQKIAEHNKTQAKT